MYKALPAIVLSVIISVVANVHLLGEMNKKQKENDEDATLSLVSISILQDSVLGLEKDRIKNQQELKLLQKEFEIQKATDELFFEVMKEGFELVANKFTAIDLQNRLKDTPFKPGELLPGFPPPDLEKYSPEQTWEFEGQSIPESKDLRIN